jgi:hypothetical protein
MTANAASTNAKVIPLRHRDAVTQVAEEVGEPKRNRGNRNHPTEYLPHLDEKKRETFWDKVDKRGPTECWIWKGATTNGRGRFKLGGRSRPVAPVAYVIAHEQEIPSGYDVDHTCQNRLCVNPAHLSLATRAQNLARRASPPVAARADDQAYRARAAAHWRGDKLMPLSPDRAVEFLDWYWRRTCESRGWSAAPAGRTERGALLQLVASSNEPTACLVLRSLIGDGWSTSWGNYLLFAAGRFGFDTAARLPASPLLAAIRGTPGVTAALAYWRAQPEARGREEWRRELGPWKPGYWARRSQYVCECLQVIGLETAGGQWSGGCQCAHDASYCCVAAVRRLRERLNARSKSRVDR